MALTSHRVQRWDLDKTYLATDTESLRGLLRIPFERAEDKKALPGVACLIQELRRSAADRGASTSVNFVTASPPQIGRAIREKLAMDGIEVDEIRFKNQMRHLVRGDFEALREHVGYKLSELLKSARAGRRAGDEWLFGDDWESDPLIYSLYADVLDGRLGWPALEALLERAGVNQHRYLQSIREALEAPGPSRRVRAICILRARPRAAEDLEAFGPRLFWFDSYLEGAFVLHALGELDARGVVKVAEASRADREQVAAAFEAVAARWPVLSREHLTLARTALVEAGCMAPPRAGAAWKRLRTRWRAWRGLAPMGDAGTDLRMPDYGRLLPSWSARARRDLEGRQHGEA